MGMLDHAISHQQSRNSASEWVFQQLRVLQVLLLGTEGAPAGTPGVQMKTLQVPILFTLWKQD